MLALFLFVVILSIYIWLFYNLEEPSTTISKQRIVTPGIVSATSRADETTPPPPAPATEIATDIKPLGTEFSANTDQPAGPDMPDIDGRESFSVEEIAPEVELAPPAEPLGPGDPMDRQNPPPPPEAMEAIPIAVLQEEDADSVTTSEPESSSQGKVPELIHPNPPSPELVKAALHESGEKSQE